MPDLERVVAGLSCREVLANLSDYVDGDLAPEKLRQVQEHLAGCNWCERFGGEFSSVVRVFREVMSDPQPVDAATQERLRERLRRELLR